MDTQLFECIIKYANLKVPNKRKPIYTTEYYLTNIIDMLTDFVKWSSLKKSKNSKGEATYHYKTIAAKHNLWSDNGVYENAYVECVQKKNIPDGSTYIELFIDSTLIINKSGIECIGYGTSCKKKKFTKLTALSSLDTKNVAIIVDKVYDKDIKIDDGSDEKKYKKISTLSHDVKNVEPVIENLRKIIPQERKIKLYGDKGYIMSSTDKKELNKKHNVKVIHCKRINQKEKNTKKEEETLKERYKVENMFTAIKSFNRIHIRRDKKISTYLGFVYLGCILKFGSIS